MGVDQPAKKRSGAMSPARVDEEEVSLHHKEGKVSF